MDQRVEKLARVKQLTKQGNFWASNSRDDYQKKENGVRADTLTIKGEYCSPTLTCVIFQIQKANRYNHATHKDQGENDTYTH